MRLIKVAAAVLNQTPLDWDGNRARIAAAIEAAREQGASLLCLPELCITGYGCEDAFFSRDMQRTAFGVLESLLPATRGMVVSFGLPVLHRNALFNAACLVADGRILGFVAKRFLAGDGIHYEPRWFKPWREGLRGELEVGGARYPLGDLFFEVGGVRIGFEICEDAWVAHRPGAALSLRGVDVLLNPSASHFAFGKHEVRKRFVLEGSRAFGVSYVYANLLGNEAGRAIYDGGALIAQGGRLLAAGPRFSFRDAIVESAVVDIDATRVSQARTASFAPDLGDTDADCVRDDFVFPSAALDEEEVVFAEWERGRHVKEEEFTRALALGLFDYLRKSRSQGFVLSLSGGADSSAIACLIALMVDLGAGEIGLEAFRQKIGRAPRLEGARTNRELMAGLLACTYQSTENSGPATLHSARTIAEAVGARFFELDVDGVVKSYVSMVSRAIGRPLDWQHDDVALQNIQARVRAPSVWLLANIECALLLATSNRSEAAVGYATMDGDTCGGLSPIAGIDKAYLRGWLRWLEKEGPSGLRPIPALEVVNALQPTAELRPPGAHQTDEDDLMPYDVLDAVERAAIRDKLGPTEVYDVMRARFPRHHAENLVVWVERFFRLFATRQWKRERYAPSFHLDDENLDPKTWCRFPILNGGFERELAELKRHAREDS